MTGVHHGFPNCLWRQLTDASIGKVGKESAAAKFASATPSGDFSIQDEKPYAEVGLLQLLRTFTLASWCS